VSDDSAPVRKGHLERALTGDAEARRRLLELTRRRPLTPRRREDTYQADDQIVEWLVQWEEALAANQPPPPALDQLPVELRPRGLRLLRGFARMARALTTTAPAPPGDAPPPPDTPRYRFEAFPARGGMAEVWRGCDTLATSEGFPSPKGASRLSSSASLASAATRRAALRSTEAPAGPSSMRANRGGRPRSRDRTRARVGPLSGVGALATDAGP
jgi:hypothetical protein